MKIPKRLQPLVDDGVIDSVVRQLMSGKEAMVFVVRCGERDALRQGLQGSRQAQLPPGRRLHREPQDQEHAARRAPWRRARASGARRRRSAWQSAEVDALYRLAAAGVRVPRPYNFHDGVLLMELVTDDEGNAAPRLNDVELTPEIALELHHRLIREVVRMLCAGVVHGDLSEFNILLGADGPVIIDLPQAVDAAGNNHAPRMLVRDVDNLRRFFGRLRARSSSPPTTARRSGRSTSPARCTRTSSSPAASSATRRPSTWRA